jgi:pimeloyl-ACP methyl ester carboxylesterase
MQQIKRVARGGAGRVERLTLANCGHSPHRDHPDAVLAAVASWKDEFPAA